MSILINGMKMPKNCMLCSFCVEEADPANGEMCLVTGKLMPPCNHERLDDCPLIEVPLHGRLIDADELEKKFCSHCDDYMSGKDECKEGCFDLKIIKSMPTVIHADKDGES